MLRCIGTGGELTINSARITYLRRQLVLKGITNGNIAFAIISFLTLLLFRHQGFLQKDFALRLHRAGYLQSCSGCF